MSKTHLNRIRALNTFAICIATSHLVTSHLVHAQTPTVAPAVAPTPFPTPSVKIVSTSHAESIGYDFSQAPIPFAAFAAPGGLASGARLSLENGALKIVNEHPGSFGISTQLKPFDALRFPVLSFDYKLQPNVKVNLFFRVKGKYHGLTFSGPDRVRPGSVKIGAVQDVKADNQWHRAYVPLRDWLQTLYATDDALVIEDLIIGNWDNSGYLVAGFGGNPTGATWWMDNFALLGARSINESAKFEIQNLNPKTPLNYTLDNGKAVALNGTALELKADDGLHWLHVSARPVGNATTASTSGAVLASYPFWISSRAPQLQTPRLRGSNLEIGLPVSGGLDLKTLKVKVGEQTFARDNAMLNWDGEKLKLDVGAAGFKWKNGEEIAVSLEGVADTLGRKLGVNATKFVVDYSQIETAVAPQIQLANRGLSWPQDGSFETNEGGWRTEGDGGAIVERDATSALRGKYALRFTSPANAAAFRAARTYANNDIGRFPIISFDYKIPPDLRADFMVGFDDVSWKIRFTDKDNSMPELGVVPDVKADNQWHHAEFNLLEMMRLARPKLKEYRINWFIVGDANWLGNAAGTQFWLDNFYSVPIESSAPLKVQVLAPDVSGIKAIAYTVDSRESSTPDVKNATPGDRIELKNAGRQWLHLRSQNGAGIWSETAHFPLWLDNAAPQIGAVTPAAQAKAAPQNISWELRDDIALDPISLRVQVAGTEYTTQSPALFYDHTRGILEWNAAAALQSGTIKPLADGARVDWKLAFASDYAGNQAPPLEGGWNYDYAQDKRAAVPVITSSSHPSAQLDTFEDGRAPWSAGENTLVSVVPQVGTTNGNNVLRVEANAPASAMQVTAREAIWDAAATMWVSFRYRIPAVRALGQDNVSMRIRLSDDRAWHIRLKGQANDSLGPAPNIVTDDQWHWAQFDVMPFLNRDPKFDRAATKIKGIDFLDPMKRSDKGDYFEIDDFALITPNSGDVKLNWQAFDLAGITNYRVAWDKNSDTVPTEETTEIAREIKAEAGANFLHVQARDGAGNLGPVAHFPVIVR